MSHCAQYTAFMYVQRNKPPPSEEELEERERLFQESREVEYAAMRAENAKIREQDLEKKAEVRLLSLLLYPCLFPMTWRSVSSVSRVGVFSGVMRADCRDRLMHLEW